MCGGAPCPPTAGGARAYNLVMDVERTIEFLLQEGARLDARIEAASLRQDRFDRQLRVLAELGTRITRRAFTAIDALAEQQRQFAEQQRQLAEQQRTTDERWNSLIDLLRRQGPGGRNGGASA